MATAAAAAMAYGTQSRCMCRFLFCIGNQPEMRGWIASVNCQTYFYKVMQKFGRFYIQRRNLFHCIC